jgi:hypothetical protein
MRDPGRRTGWLYGEGKTQSMSAGFGLPYTRYLLLEFDRNYYIRQLRREGGSLWRRYEKNRPGLLKKFSGTPLLECPTDCVRVLSYTVCPLKTMSNLTPAQFSFLFRQEWLIIFGLTNVFYGVYKVHRLI